MHLIFSTLAVVLLLFVAEVSTTLQRSSHVTEDQFPPVIDDYAEERDTGAEVRFYFDTRYKLPSDYQLNYIL